MNDLSTVAQLGSTSRKPNDIWKTNIKPIGSSVLDNAIPCPVEADYLAERYFVWFDADNPKRAYYPTLEKIQIKWQQHKLVQQTLQRYETGLPRLLGRAKNDNGLLVKVIYVILGNPICTLRRSEDGSEPLVAIGSPHIEEELFRRLNSREKTVWSYMLCEEDVIPLTEPGYLPQLALEDHLAEAGFSDESLSRNTFRLINQGVAWHIYLDTSFAAIW